VAPHCNYFLLRILGPHTGGYEGFYFLGYNAMESVENHQTFETNVSPLSSRWKPELAACFMQGLLLDHEDEGDVFLSKLRLIFNGPHAIVTNQKIKLAFFICSFIKPKDKACDIGSVCVKSQIFRNSW
jgi:hypothetical protein